MCEGDLGGKVVIEMIVSVFFRLKFVFLMFVIMVVILWCLFIYSDECINIIFLIRLFILIVVVVFLED